MTNKNLPANPLAALIKQAGDNLPARTGEAERVASRLRTAGDEDVVLADVSQSMAEPAGDKRKIDLLRAAFDYALRGHERLIAFNSSTLVLSSPSDLPAPAGGTALHLALAEAAAYRPRYTLLISDGQPDSEELALREADNLSGIIDVIYCGPADDARAISFMRRLARTGSGKLHIYDVQRITSHRWALPSTMRRLLLDGGS